MGYNPVTGQTLDGKQLATLPPNASSEEQTTAINDVISKLNNNTQDIVQTGSFNVINDGSFITLTTYFHGLGYTPRAYTSIDAQTTTLTVGSTTIHPNVPLPAWLQASSDGTNLHFQVYMQHFVDDQNLYVATLNSTGNPTTRTIVFHLTREPVTVT